MKHLVVLLHGLNGTPSELAYILKTLANEKIHADDIIINPDCNLDKTKDGIFPGGERVFKWILNTMLTETITHISFIGHSLGGIYSRCCIGMLYEHGILPQLLTPVNFITLATPHLGSRQHVYLWDKAHAWVVEKYYKNQTLQELTMTDDTNLDHSKSVFYRLIGDSYINPLKLFPNLVTYANTFDAAVNYNTSAIKRIGKLKKDKKYKWPDIVPDDVDENWTADVTAEDKMYHVLNALHWKRFAVFPDRLLAAHADIIVRVEETDVKFGKHVVEHLLTKFIRPEAVEKASLPLSKPRRCLVVVVGEIQAENIVKSLTNEYKAMELEIEVQDYNLSGSNAQSELNEWLSKTVSSGYTNLSFVSNESGNEITQKAIEHLFVTKKFAVTSPTDYLLISSNDSATKSDKTKQTVEFRFANSLFKKTIIKPTEE